MGDRTPSRDRRDSTVRHSHSWSESGRMSAIPMWDSSDPGRAPPPLPLNPGTSSPTTKPNTSAGIAAAAKQFIDKARESAPLASYTTNRETPHGSPERALVRGQQHKRMQSIQSGNVKDLRNYLDSKSPERGPERPSSRSGASTFSHTESREDLATPVERASTPTSTARDPFKGTPQLRPSSRPGPRPLLGENTPPSATMLALQTMQVPDQPLHDFTNGPGTPTPSRPSSHGHDDFSSQLLNLTTIATSLQREMAQLSRRSKDNATDLISLKDATNQRDEDIRKSLRELANNHAATTPGLLGPPPILGGESRSACGYTPFFDSKPRSSSPVGSRSYSVPRATSVPTFFDERVGSPSPYSVEGAASVAMLEKIIREMVTKEGQERLQGSLSELLEKSRKENGDAAKKVEELSEFIKEKSGSQALIPLPLDGPPKLELNFDSPGRARGEGGETTSAEELMSLLHRIRDSVTHTGGSTGEVKSLVRDLRGELLGMGRELGRKLDQVSETALQNTLDRSIADGQGSQNAEEVQRIVEDGMLELKEHMSGMMRQRADEDESNMQQLVNTKSGPDGEEIFNAIKQAFEEHGHSLAKAEPEVVNAGVDREAVLDAVREGLKDFEPNIELQQFGLERDEILTVLKEGLEDYQNNRPEPAAPGIDKAQVFDAMQEAMKDFQPSMPDNAVVLMREERAELLAEVKARLEDYESNRPEAAAAVIDKDHIYEAVQEAMKDLPALASAPAGEIEEMKEQRVEILTLLKDRMDELQHRAESAAAGFDKADITQAMEEQRAEILNVLRERLEDFQLRAEPTTMPLDLNEVHEAMQQQRAEISSILRDRLDEFQARNEPVAAGLERNAIHEAMEDQRAEILAVLKEHLDEMQSRDEASAPSLDKGELFEVVQEAMKGFNAPLPVDEISSLKVDLLASINQSLDDHKASSAGQLVRAEPSEQPELFERVFDAMQDALKDFKAPLPTEAIASLKAELLDSINLALEEHQAASARQVVPVPLDGAADQPDLAAKVHESMQEALKDFNPRIPDEQIGLLKEELLSNIQQMLDDQKSSSAVQIANIDAAEKPEVATKAEVDSLGQLCAEIKEKIGDIRFPDLADTSRKADVELMKDELLGSIQASLEELKATFAAKPAEIEDAEKPELMTKADVDGLGLLCTEIREKVYEFQLPDPAEAPTKADIEQLQGLIADFRESHDKMRDSYETDIAVTAKAFDDRKKEFEDTVQEISDVKTSLNDIKDELLLKMGEGETDLVATLGESIKSLEEKASTEVLSLELKELADKLTHELERSQETLEAMKVDNQQAAETSLEKQAENKLSMVEELSVKLEARFDGLMSKYDDAQKAAEEKVQSMEEKAVEQQEILNGTKTMAEDLRLSIDTLGGTLTTFAETFPAQMDKMAEESRTVFTKVDETYTKLDDTYNKLDEAHIDLKDENALTRDEVVKVKTAIDAFAITMPEQMEKMAEDSKTVFSRVDDTYNKLDEAHLGLKDEHSVTREEVAKVLSAVETMQADASEQNPRFMITLKEVQALIGQHYEHSQKASDAAEEDRQVIKELQEQLRGLGTQNEEMKTNITSIPSLLPAMLPAPFEPTAPAEKYDDSTVQDKLDQLMTHAAQAKESSTQLSRLDEIHEKVLATAAEVSAFVATQTRQITAAAETREKDAEELALLLERRQVQKDEIETGITALNSEKESLTTDVATLRTEKEALAAQKSRLAADVSALEMAMRIRREELREMDRKAEAIERRMLEGVMDQSRLLLLARNTHTAATKRPPQHKGRDLRTPSTASDATAQTVTSAFPSASALKQSQALALRSRPGMMPRQNGGAAGSGAAANSGASRRIMSLNEIDRNIGSGTGSRGGTSQTASLLSGGGGVKRSQSVRNAVSGARKGSWGGKRDLGFAGVNGGAMGGDKENDILSEADEELEEEEELASEADTLSRRESGVSYTEGTGSVVTYGEGETPGMESRRSLGASESSYETGSYMTGSDFDDPRASLGAGSSAGGVIGLSSTVGGRTVDGEESEESEDDEPTQLAIPYGKPAGKDQLVGKFAPPSDSGLGTDLPSAAFGSEGGMSADYFKA